MARKKKQLPPGVLITCVVLFLLIILTIFRLIKDTKTVSDETSANSTPLENTLRLPPRKRLMAQKNRIRMIRLFLKTLF